MKMNDIIKTFNQDETKFAKEAVLEAKRNKGKINDYLLEHLESFSKDLEKYKGKDCPISIVYSIYLLAEFEDKRLFPILIKIYENKKYRPERIIGECVTERLHSIIVSVFDGNFEALNKIIENKKIDEYVRCQFLKCYIYFYDNNMISSKELEKYLLRLIELYNYEDDPIYDEILEVIINAHLFTMIEDVKKMFHYGVIDPMIRGGYDSFIDYIFDYEDTFDKFTKIEDTIKEMSWWAFFDKEDNIFDEEKTSKALEKVMKNDLKKLNNIPTNKIGRNDPCPCGSGKKYKKCCMDKKETALPYNSFIEDSWRKYPKKKDSEEKRDLYDFYKEEYIEIDKLLYKAMKHRIIPLYITRDYNTENKINLEYYKEAFEKIKAIQKKEKFKTLDGYDNKVSIHYSIYEFYQKYSKLLVEILRQPYCSNRNTLLNNLEELSDFFYDNYDLNNSNEALFLKTKYDLYNLKDKLDEGIEYFEDKLERCLPELKYDIYEYLFDLYMCKYDDITKLEDMIDKENDEELKQHLEELKLDYIDL